MGQHAVRSAAIRETAPCMTLCCLACLAARALEKACTVRAQSHYCCGTCWSGVPGLTWALAPSGLWASTPEKQTKRPGCRCRLSPSRRGPCTQPGPHLGGRSALGQERNKKQPHFIHPMPEVRLGDQTSGFELRPWTHPAWVGIQT